MFAWHILLELSDMRKVRPEGPNHLSRAAIRLAHPSCGSRGRPPQGGAPTPPFRMAGLQGRAPAGRRCALACLRRLASEPVGEGRQGNLRSAAEYRQVRNGVVGAGCILQCVPGRNQTVFSWIASSNSQIVSPLLIRRTTLSAERYGMGLVPRNISDNMRWESLATADRVGDTDISVLVRS